MDQIWEYEEINRLIKSKKPELVRMGLYPFDKEGHKIRKRYKDSMLLKMAISRAKKFPPTQDDEGNLILPYFYNIIN